MSRVSNRLVEMAADPSRGEPGPPASRAFLRPFLGVERSLAAVFAALRFLVVGAGAVGRVIAEDLARLAPAELLIVDPKSYRPEHIVTQPIRPGEIGGPKAELTARACKEISPATLVRYFVGTVQELPLLGMTRFDRVVLSTDNLLAEVETGQLCTRLGIPLHHASVHPETMVAHVRSFANQTADSPCPACQFSAHEWELLNRGVTFSCDGTPAENAQPEVTAAPTASNSSLCGLAAKLAMIELVRDTMGLGTRGSDHLLEYCGFTHRSVLSDFHRNPNCPCEHARYAVTDAPRPLVQCSLAELTRHAGVDEPLDFTIGEWWWAERGICTGGHDQAVGRLVAPGEERLGQCPQCGEPLAREPFYLHHRLSATCFETIGHRPLRDLGAPEVEWVLLRHESAGVLFQNPISDHD